MAYYDRHIFICTNVRPPQDSRGCCSAKGSEALILALKAEIKAQGIREKIRVNKAGCLDSCAHGPSMVIYPEGVWYGGVQPSDLKEIVESHLKNGVPVARLQIPRDAPDHAGK